MKKGLIILLYFICIVYCLEILLFFFTKNKININNINNIERKGDYEAFKERRNEANIYPIYNLSSLKNIEDYSNNNFLEKKIISKKKIPLRGPINKLSLDSNEDRVREIVVNDKYGFKNYNKNYQDSIDLMIIGDSFAEGVPFANKDDVSGLINLNSDYNSINYGISGAGPLNSLGVLREYGKNFKPKDIFYFFYEGNDLKNLIYEKDTFLIKYLDRSFNQDLFNSATEVKSFLSSYEQLFFKNLPDMIKIEKNNKNKAINSVKIKLNFIENLQDIIELKKLKEILVPKNAYFSRYEKIDYATFEKVIIEMKHEVDKWDGKITLVYLPSWTRYHLGFSISHKVIKKNIKNITVKNNVTFIDMDHVFKKNELDNINLFNLGKYGHYTKPGYKKISDTIIEKLKAK